MRNSLFSRVIIFTTQVLAHLALVLIILLLSNPVICQAENALPPGPARLHGTVKIDGKPFANATIIFFYQRNNATHHARYTSDRDGRFTVYVYEDISCPVLAIFVDKKLRLIYEPKNYMVGTNYFELFHVNVRSKAKLEQRFYKKALKTIDL